MATVWALIFLGIHSYPIVPNIISEQECHRLYAEIKAAGWAGTTVTGNDHRCIAYQTRVN